MAKTIPYLEALPEVAEKLPRGVFVSVQHEGKRNTMAVGWGGITFFWGKPIFIAPIRPSRYTHDLLAKSGEFTVSVPGDRLAEQMRFAGTQSGRDVDKFSGHGLTAAAAQQVQAPIVAECALHLECRVLAENELLKERTAAEVLRTSYPKDDLHTLFFGEILTAYRTE